MRVHVIQPDAAEYERLRSDLREQGYDVVDDPTEGRIDVWLVSLHPDGSGALESLAAELAAPGARRGPLLFSGGDESTLDAALAAYPRASFVRADQMLTALVSMAN
jgi:hypothetical protein